MKTILTTAAALGAVAALAGPATATTIPSCTPTNDVQIEFRTVNAFETTRAYRVTANGAVAAEASTTFRRPGRTITVDLPTPTGPVSVRVYATLNFGSQLLEVGSFECGVPTPAPEPGGETGPPGNPPVVPLTCADYKALYPKAGKARLRSWGCPVPRVVKTTRTVTRRTIDTIECRRPGDRVYRVDRITIVWTREGVVVRRLVGTVRVPGPVCPYIAVAG